VTQHFDYIIIGSGAAGSVVAARLAEASAGTICVLEAGGDNRKLLVDIPAGFVRNLQNPRMMWKFDSEPTENTGQRSIYLPQGKILGGSTSINGLVYNRGQAEDFNHWASLGNAGWSYHDVLPYFRKSETFDNPQSQYRGGSGPLRIGYPDQTHPLCDSFIHAAADIAGVPVHNDYNSETQAGAGYYQRFIHQGKRENVAARYLSTPLSQGKLTLMTNTLATRIGFDDSRAVSVDIIRDGTAVQLFADKEILLCAGAVNSATLLQRSGVADASQSQSAGVPVVHHLPGVGENFQDHYFARLAFRLRKGVDSLNLHAQGWRLGAQMLRWALRRPSILAWSPSIAYAFLNSTSSSTRANVSSSRPDFQFVFSHGSYRPGRIYELDSFPAVTCGFTQQRPHSKGYVKIVSPDIDDKPVVQPNYLQDHRDREMAISGVRISRRIMQSTHFASVLEKEQFPGAQLQSDNDILDFVRSTGNTGYHLVGTCKMGVPSDPLAVVAPDLQVHGLQGIRVIDASIMPTVTSSNTCAATIMIAEKAADIIITETRNNTGNMPLAQAI